MLTMKFLPHSARLTGLYSCRHYQGKFPSLKPVKRRVPELYTLSADRLEPFKFYVQIRFVFPYHHQAVGSSP